jgi:hypothetical protein
LPDPSNNLLISTTDEAIWRLFVIDSDDADLYRKFHWRFCDLSRFGQLVSLLIPMIGERVFLELIPSINIAWNNDNADELIVIYKSLCKEKLLDFSMNLLEV